MPQGKVLKITSITGFANAGTQYYSGKIGEHAINDFVVDGNGVIPVKYSIWPPAGAHVVTINHNNSFGSSAGVTLSFSGIEFNVVQ